MRIPAGITALVLILLALTTRPGHCQSKCAFTHYSVEDGLSEGVALTMHQDREGLMWFGTFDGLNRFDGYSFKVYKSGFNSSYGLTNNRVDRITEDDLGHLWIMNNDGEVYRMNTRTEEFINFNEISASGQEDYSPVTQIYCFSGGETWLSHEAGTCIRVISSATSSEYKLDRFDFRNGATSNPAIRIISKDSHGTVWILSDNGLFRVTGEDRTPEQVLRNGATTSAKTFFCLHEQGDRLWFGTGNGTIIVTDSDAGIHEEIKMGVSSDIISIKPLNQRELIILTSGDGFFVYTPVTGEKKQYVSRRYPELPTNQMVSVYIDRYGEAWIESMADGVTHFDPFGGTVKHYKMNVDKTNPNVLLPSFVIFEDINDILWICPRGGGFSRYNRIDRRLEYFFNEPGSDDRRFPNLIHSAMSDNQGNLWMCTITRGIEKISFFPNQFKVISPKQIASSHSENEVRAIFEDNNRYLWAATRDGRVYLFDPEHNMVGYLRDNGTFSSGEAFNALVYVITQDRNGNIWMGSKGRGLFRLEPTGNSSPCCYSITGFSHDDDDPWSLSHDNVYSIYEDPAGRIWVGTFNGGLNYITEENGRIRFVNSFNRLKNYPYSNHKRVRYITSDHNDRIWVGTTSGLVIFDRNFTDPAEAQFLTCFFDPAVETSLANNDVHYIYCSPSDEIYVATFGGGLNRVINDGSGNEKPAFKSYTVKTGAPDDVILSIVDDQEGNLWLSSERGILKFDTRNESFEIYSEQSGVEKRYFSEATGLRTAGSEIMFGFDNGIYCFNPSQVRKVNYVPPLVFTRMTVAGTDIHTAGGASTADEMAGPVIDLRHTQKSLNIEYAALDYRNPKTIQYAHMMQGVDPDWIIGRGQRSAAYTNLDPGQYTFSVRSTNSDGIWVDNTRTVRITVNPSFWQTTLSRVLLTLITLIIIGLTIYVIFTFYKLRHKVEVEQLITNLKLKFFTDISHELRTPLTLISSPVTNILQNNNIEPEVRDQLTLVQSNTQRMLRLVNQILDFRKVQSKKMRLRIEEFALGPFISDICSDFRKVAEDKGIHLIVDDLSRGEMVWADKDKVEKIAYNLITNALKFTPRGKRVNITVTKNTDSLEFIVADQGTGLSREKMKNLFMRFGSEDREVISMQPGTGIGLSLSHELAELHRAELTAESEEGKGATFRVTFRLGFSHFNNETEFVLADGQSSPSSRHAPTAMQEDDDSDETDKKDDDDPVLLFVEDNEELRSFIKIILSDGYHVIEAGNGIEGFEIARSQLPDIIITDLMMPEMDGLELARRIREEVTTSHIPVVVLTAKTDLDTQVEALKRGADDFITKPFSSTYLRARIENILQQRKKLQELFLSTLADYPPSKANRAYEVTPSEPFVESYDDKLMKNLMEVMEQNIDNAGLTVDELVSKIGIGRSVFFKKLKSLTGLAPIEFIREVRVKRAAQLIESGEYTISQVTYMVGCNDPRYFSRIFKHRFNITPSEYRDRHAKQKQSL